MADGIVLVGMPGSGKSTVGRLVAERLGRTFLDTDEMVERETGQPAAQLIEEHGEAAFRAAEWAAVQTACAVDDAVIAAGGGAVLDPLNRWAFKEHGLRLRLDAPADVLATRLSASGVRRPLLGDHIADGLTRTMAERAPVYAAVDMAIDTRTNLETIVTEIADVATAIRTAALWRPLYEAPFDRHDSRTPGPGELFLGAGLTRKWFADLIGAHFSGRAATLADARALDASPTLADVLPTERLCLITGGEEAKSMARLEQILAWLTSIGAERDDPLIVVGGGTLGDVGGLAAALHKRGMPLVHVPTTWLAQAEFVDRRQGCDRHGRGKERRGDILARLADRF